MFGGLTIGRDYGDQDSGDLNNPNFRINNQGYIGFDSPYQIRGGFSYRLPADVQFSGIDARGDRPAAEADLPGDHDAVPGLTQVTQNVQVRRARRVPLSVGEPRRSPARADVPHRAVPASSRRSMSSTSSTTTP